MSLSNNDLYRKYDQLIKLKQETYEIVHKRCVNTIKNTSSLGKLSCIYEIPKYIVGGSYPLVNPEYCANYVINKILKDNTNIRCEFIKPNVIICDWRRNQK